MELDKVGIDLGKTVFHLVAPNTAGETVVRKKFSRSQLLRFTAEWPTIQNVTSNTADLP